MTTKLSIQPADVEAFLAQKRIAVVGASDDPKNFGGTVYRAFKAHGYDVVPVNRNAIVVDGDACSPDLPTVPGDVDAVLVMVNRDDAVAVVGECVDRGFEHVWLFKGLGGSSAVSDEAVERCRSNGIAVVAGACPLMFLEPVAGFHKFHRALRHLNGSLAKAS